MHVRGDDHTAEDSTAGGRELGDTGNSKNPLAPQARGNGKAHLHDGRIVVRPQHFSADARAGRQLLGPSASMSAGGDTACPDVPQRASTVAAEYQHAPAALVYRRVEGSSQVVDLYVCGNPRPVRSTTLSVP